MSEAMFANNEEDMRRRWLWNTGSEVAICLREIDTLRAERIKLKKALKIMVDQAGVVPRRLEIITNLLNDETPVHPIGCNCAIKSRQISHHSLDCPYRALREMVRVLRDRPRSARDTGAKL